ncbi:MAG: zinc ribbon domain-containing protein [Planctomycetota bacterium]
MLNLAFILFGISVLGLLIGLIGRRVGNEPRCRSCTHDLTGIHADDADVRCPECGCTTSAKRIRHGHRVRRPRIMACAGAIFVAALSIVVMDQYVHAIGRSWYMFLPNGTLVDMLIAQPMNELVIDELQHRLDDSRLGQDACTRLLHSLDDSTLISAKPIRTRPPLPVMPARMKFFKSLIRSSSISRDVRLAYIDRHIHYWSDTEFIRREEVTQVLNVYLLLPRLIDDFEFVDVYLYATFDEKIWQLELVEDSRASRGKQTKEFNAELPDDVPSAELEDLESFLVLQVDVAGDEFTYEFRYAMYGW